MASAVGLSTVEVVEVVVVEVDEAEMCESTILDVSIIALGNHRKISGIKRKFSRTTNLLLDL